MSVELTKLIDEKTAECQQLFEAGISAHEASQKLVNLSSLLASLNTAITNAHFALNVKKRDVLEDAGSVAKARVLAEATEEWRLFIQLLNQKESLLELMRAVKYYLKASVEEYKEQS